MKEPDDFNAVLCRTIKNEIIPERDKAQIGRKIVDAFAEKGLRRQAAKQIVEAVQQTICRVGIVLGNVNPNFQRIGLCGAAW